MSLHPSIARFGALVALSVPLAHVTAQTPEDSLLAAERAVSDASARDGFAKAIVAALATDGTILWPAAPVVVGTESVQRLLAAQRLLDSLRITWQPLGVEVAGDGGLGVTWGVAVALRNGVPQLGRYIAAWRRESGAWRLAAMVTLGVYPAAATVLPQGIGPLRQPPVTPAGAAAGFIAADVGFARLAGDSGAARAFERYAAPEAVTFGGGILIRGPKAIGESLDGGPPTDWKWHPVLAGASGSRDLGYTVGESDITPKGGTDRPGKYLTIWRRLPNGDVKFLTDGGNARPPSP